MIVPPQNPWGIANGLEPQRNDLWVLNLEPVKEFLQILNPTLPSLPENTMHYAMQVIPPEKRISTTIVRRDSNPVHMPDFDEALGEFRVEFIHDSPNAVQTSAGVAINPGTAHSRIFALIYAWHELARVGRGGRSGQSVDLSHMPGFFELFRTEVAGGRFATWTYRFDLDLFLLRGSYKPLPEVDYSADDPRQLETASGYRLVNAWCAAFQPGTLVRDGAEKLTLTASLFCEDYIPIRRAPFLTPTTRTSVDDLFG